MSESATAREKSFATHAVAGGRIDGLRSLEHSFSEPRNCHPKPLGTEEQRGPGPRMRPHCGAVLGAAGRRGCMYVRCRGVQHLRAASDESRKLERQMPAERTYSYEKPEIPGQLSGLLLSTVPAIRETRLART